MADLNCFNNCCGAYELGSLGSVWPTFSPERLLRQTKELTTIRCAFVVFTDNRGGYGQRLADYIEQHNLGPIVSSGWRVNRNTNREICLWTWHIDQMALDRWRIEQNADRSVNPLVGEWRNSGIQVRSVELRVT